MVAGAGRLHASFFVVLGEARPSVVLRNNKATSRVLLQLAVSTFQKKKSSGAGGLVRLCNLFFLFLYLRWNSVQMKNSKMQFSSTFLKFSSTGSAAANAIRPVLCPIGTRNYFGLVPKFAPSSCRPESKRVASYFKDVRLSSIHLTSLQWRRSRILFAAVASYDAWNAFRLLVASNPRRCRHARSCLSPPGRHVMIVYIPTHHHAIAAARMRCRLMVIALLREVAGYRRDKQHALVALITLRSLFVDGKNVEGDNILVGVLRETVASLIMPLVSPSATDVAHGTIEELLDLAFILFRR